jgi:hypothetical protein
MGENIGWHSSLGLKSLEDRVARRFIASLPVNTRVMAMFASAGRDVLVHKTTKCLWRMSKDGKSIEPVFANDVLTEDDVRQAMEA